MMPEAKWIHNGKEVGRLIGPWRPVEGDYLEDLASGHVVKVVKCVFKGDVLYCYVEPSS